ncbi:PQQ-binding-like beta-propeller repeat protein [Dactylosporangium sp. NPDC049140]|uniref:outer membrane protein assembly factor BamB family protein n=1 Tax=Dactylosporangium sp. NPDC049140 TaxID=3155647 RepID=UPI0033F85F07
MRLTILARPDGRMPRWVWAAAIAAGLAVVLCVSVPLLALRPGSRVSPAKGAYPAPAVAKVGVVAQLRAAPVILDGRLRVFATRNDVWAEPLTAPDGNDSYWSYHRWPAEVLGIVAFGAVDAAPPVVVVKWSDGMLSSVDAERGTIAWKTQVQTKDSDKYWGRRTGTRTVYGDETLFSLYSARSGSSPVVISSGNTEVVAFDPVSGRPLWTVDLPACHGVDWTGEQVFATILCSEGMHTIHLYDVGTGRPVGTWVPPGVSSSSAPADRSWIRWLTRCRTASSECQGFQVPGAGPWRIHADGSVTQEPVTSPGVVDRIAGDVIIRRDSGLVIGIRQETDAQLWQGAFDARSGIAADAGVVYLLSAKNDLTCIDASTGEVRATVQLPSATAWTASDMYAVDGFVMIERVNPDARDRDGDNRYYYGSRPVVLAAC